MAIGIFCHIANILTCYFHHLFPLPSFSSSQLVESDIVKLNYILLMRHDTSGVFSRAQEECWGLSEFWSQSPLLMQQHFVMDSFIDSFVATPEMLPQVCISSSSSMSDTFSYKVVELQSNSFCPTKNVSISLPSPASSFLLLFPINLRFL